MRYTERELFLLDGVAERVVRHRLPLTEAMRILMLSYGLGRRHSRESVRWYLGQYRDRWLHRIDPKPGW